MKLVAFLAWGATHDGIVQTMRCLCLEVRKFRFGLSTRAARFGQWLGVELKWSSSIRRERERQISVCEACSSRMILSRIRVGSVTADVVAFELLPNTQNDTSSGYKSKDNINHF